jgi:hypothetical protein
MAGRTAPWDTDPQHLKQFSYQYLPRLSALGLIPNTNIKSGTKNVGVGHSGGFKQSSANTFKEQGQAAMDFYTLTKTIYVNHG